MHEASSHDSRSRERIGPNTYRRRTKAGEVVYEVGFRDVDGAPALADIPSDERHRHHA